MAAKQRNAASLNKLVTEYDAARNKRDEDPLVASNLDVTFGGDLERGKDVFYNKTATSCLRCHKIGWDGGNVGPELTDLGLKHDRRYIIEAIANPNKVIAKGFGRTEGLDRRRQSSHGRVERRNRRSNYFAGRARQRNLDRPRNSRRHQARTFFDANQLARATHAGRIPGPCRILGQSKRERGGRGRRT